MRGSFVLGRYYGADAQTPVLGLWLSQNKLAKWVTPDLITEIPFFISLRFALGSPGCGLRRCHVCNISKCLWYPTSKNRTLSNGELWRHRHNQHGQSCTRANPFDAATCSGRKPIVVWRQRCRCLERAQLGICEQGKAILHQFRLVFPHQSDVLKPLHPFQSIGIGFRRVSDGNCDGFDIESWSLAGIMKEQVVPESWTEGRIAVISNRLRTDQFNPPSFIRLEKSSRIPHLLLCFIQLPIRVNQLAAIKDEGQDADNTQNDLRHERYALKSVGFAGKLIGLVLILIGIACGSIGHWGLVWVDDWNWRRRTVFGVAGWGLAFIFNWYGLPILLGHLAWISPLPLGIFGCWLQQ